jgi:hypothetical protein
MTDEPKRERPADNAGITKTRIVVWIAMGGVGLVLVIMGIVGIISKG